MIVYTPNTGVWWWAMVTNIYTQRQPEAASAFYDTEHVSYQGHGHTAWFNGTVCLTKHETAQIHFN